MESRVALIGIMLEDISQVERLNTLLTQYRDYIIGRMGIPYRAKNIQLISIAIDAPADTISALSGNLGNLNGVTAKVVYAKCNEA
ncbi:MAG: iron-only hydrogenase system regulator [Clostridia bacterium]|nr:iron-only hydrogenase system regulator [Clostridia bacterium]